LISFIVTSFIFTPPCSTTRLASDFDKTRFDSTKIEMMSCFWGRNFDRLVGVSFLLKVFIKYSSAFFASCLE